VSPCSSQPRSLKAASISKRETTTHPIIRIPPAPIVFLGLKLPLFQLRGPSRRSVLDKHHQAPYATFLFVRAQRETPGVPMCGTQAAHQANLELGPMGFKIKMGPCAICWKFAMLRGKSCSCSEQSRSLNRFRRFLNFTASFVEADKRAVLIN